MNQIHINLSLLFISVVLLENGEVHTFGHGNHGQLGQGHANSSNVPVLIDVPERITQIAAGANHTVLLSASGQVYTCGNFQVRLYLNNCSLIVLKFV